MSTLKGYSCYSLEEIYFAYRLLEEQGVKEFVIKATDECAGIGIYFCSSYLEFENVCKKLDFELAGTRGLKYNILRS